MSPVSGGLTVAMFVAHGGFMKQMTLFIGLLLVFTAQAQMPPYAGVKSVQIDGSGCDAGSANAVITSDLNFLSVLYDRFSVEIGKGTANPGSKSAEKNCTIAVMVQVPPGWNFEFESVDYRGFAEVPNKMAIAYQLISAEVYGGRGIGFNQNLMRGPKTENFATTVRRANLGAIGALTGGAGCSNEPQDVKVKIKSVIGVRNLLASITKPAVRLVVDSTDASFRQNLRLNWRQCR